MKKTSLFSKKDIRQIESSGISSADVEKQLAYYRQGPNYLKLSRPCTVKDGIAPVTSKQRKKLIDLYEREAGRYKLIKFVPASGAASRMFADWFSVIEKGSFGSGELNRKFFRDLKKFPFFPLIKEDKTGKELLDKKDIKGLLKFILSPDGLNYGDFPKALIPFHRYPSGNSNSHSSGTFAGVILNAKGNKLRTALEEHLLEATGYIAGTSGVSRIHFTLSTEHKQAVTKYLKKIMAKDECFGREKYDITFSFQSVLTNTIAVDEANLPVRDEAGRLVFRPAGHGALLTNLNNLDADFIFVRNIDNIAPELISKENLPFRKMLGGMAMKTQKEIFSFLHDLKAGETDSSYIEKMVKYCSRRLNITFPQSFAKQTKKKKVEVLLSLLDRPLRVCGMVKNDGEPGGGPFWLEEKDGSQTLQIVENGHVDKRNPEQSAIWLQAKYFNPVDMVCCIKNYRGEKFVLDNYVDKDAYLISSKNEKGIKLKALEVPGLWNGGMAYWNTVFVELPLRVFNPVKTVYDLLRPEHLYHS